MTTHAEDFVALHRRDELFIMANPVDAGTAALFASLGFPALGTSSAALARSLGRRDGANAITRDEAIAHAVSMAAVAGVPVSGDFENGYGDDPAAVAETVDAAINAGLAGCCIEDATGLLDDPIYGPQLATDRIRAGAEAMAGRPFVLVARAGNHLHGRQDLADTIARLQAFQEAGATAVYAPGLVELADIATVVREVDVPVNVLIGMPGQDYSLDDLAAVGVRRVSVGSGFHRVAMAAVAEHAQALLDNRSTRPMVQGAPDLEALFPSNS